MNPNKTDLAFRWLNTDRLSVIEDIRRFESLEEAAAYNHSLYCDQLEAGNVSVQLDVDDFEAALREIIEREGINRPMDRWDAAEWFLGSPPEDLLGGLTRTSTDAEIRARAEELIVEAILADASLDEGDVIAYIERLLHPDEDEDED